MRRICAYAYVAHILENGIWMTIFFFIPLFNIFVAMEFPTLDGFYVRAFVKSKLYKLSIIAIVWQNLTNISGH